MCLLLFLAASLSFPHLPPPNLYDLESLWAQAFSHSVFAGGVYGLHLMHQLNVILKPLLLLQIGKYPLRHSASIANSTVKMNSELYCLATRDPPTVPLSANRRTPFSPWGLPETPQKFPHLTLPQIHGQSRVKLFLFRLFKKVLKPSAFLHFHRHRPGLSGHHLHYGSDCSPLVRPTEFILVPAPSVLYTATKMVFWNADVIMSLLWLNSSCGFSSLLG